MDNIIKKYMHDINVSINSIEEFIGDDYDFHKYLANKMLRRAVEREFEIIGEAMTRINNINPDLPISSKKQIISMRNRVIHGYDKIDDEIVWGTIIRHIPILKKEIEELMQK